MSFPSTLRRRRRARYFGAPANKTQSHASCPFQQPHVIDSSQTLEQAESTWIWQFSAIVNKQRPSVLAGQFYSSRRVRLPGTRPFHL